MQGGVTMHHGTAAMAPPPPLPPPPPPFHRRGFMHMTFFWGKSAEVLFSGWPGTSSVMYAVALIFVFAMAVLVEWLSHCRLIKPGANAVAAGLFRTALYAVRSGLSYMVMLAVMSYNGGVFLAAVAGHAVGFAVFGRRVFRKSGGVRDGHVADLSSAKC
ncbi:copper transporter 4-like [Malania oleifera]|uniref:copper transporter 4-like n=1 Tax=Malania oleifera TaxID=397392 RepID=UPI0025AE2D19|nr:copper transporter 4-like [Malania oleifera]